MDFRERREKFKNEVNVDEATNSNLQAANSPELSQVVRLQNVINLNKEADHNFDPNIAAKAISNKQLLEFAQFVKDTPYEKFIAYKDPKVQELINFIMSAIIFENERMHIETFPIEIHNRYKSDLSLKDKIDRWSKRDEKQGVEVTDYLGFKIIPEVEYSIFSSDGDTILQELIDKREEIRKYIADEYKELSKKPNMTCAEYCEKCKKVITELKNIFPEEAVTRKEYYDTLINNINESLEKYNEFVDNPNEVMHFTEFSEITSVNINEQLNELRRHNPNEVILYVLKKNLMNIFENSDLLKSLGVSVIHRSDDSERTKPKRSKLGYISEFIGLDLTISLDNEKEITLPIEVQAQARTQYEDSQYGFSAHAQLPGKSLKLKSIPKPFDEKSYTDPQEKLKALRASHKDHNELLSYLMHICPTTSDARSTTDNFGKKRIVITPKNLYESFSLLARYPTGSTEYNTIFRYLEKLFEMRNNLIPTGEHLLPKYLRREDIPNPSTDYTKYNQFFNELKSSLKNTLREVFGKINEEKTSTVPNQINSDEEQMSH